MIGSRCSFSYLPAKKWWMRPFEFMAKCQEKTIQEQYTHGVRLFDLRIRFDDRGCPYVCHGLLVYRMTEEELLKELDWINSMGDCFVRVLLETMKVHLNGNLGVYQEECFVKWCSELERFYHNIKFTGGESKMIQKVAYDFKTETQPTIKEGSSTWWPKLRYLIKGREKEKENVDFNLIDFI